jgi:uncharacterized protein YdaU (DUF1376 family)
MAKIRRIDWSPSEWLAGTRGLTVRQTAVYITVLNIIYDRGRPCPNDATFIAGHFGVAEEENWRGLTRSIRASIDRLVEMGKLIVCPDGDLTNERADLELNKARERIKVATEAGKIGGSYRKLKSVDIPSTSRRHPVDINPLLSNSNDLTQAPARIINHHYDSESLSKISTGAVRDPARGAGAPGRAHTGTTKERVAALAAIARAKLLGSV